MNLDHGPSSPESLQSAQPRLVYKGLTVPYIAAWSSEDSPITGDPDLRLREHVVTGARHVAYADERPEDRAYGVLWGRMPNSPGIGQPRFASLHTARQREVMARGGCQVCGGAGEVWMVPATVWADYLDVRGEGAPYDTSDPPICRACIPLAARQCPNLRQHSFVFLSVRKWSVSGVRGYVGDPHTFDFGPVRDIALHGAVGYDAARLRLTLAKGLLVTLRGIAVHTDPDRVRSLGRRRGWEPTPSSRQAAIPTQRAGW
ncbi:hypothetical protein [Catenulispora rubra]|uniref:hypothetical protein n=1 Tax=Catenulispora rubra TaxID=280293 RepID=UPI00189243BC|nr:hypothetical protein [Catenulispora rubra]